MNCQAIATKSKETWYAWCLMVSVVPPSDVCNVSGFLGAWHLVVRVPHQAVWKSFCLPAQEQRQAIMQRPNLCSLALDVRGLQDFGDILKVGLLVFLELWLRTYTLSCGSG